MSKGSEQTYGVFCQDPERIMPRSYYSKEYASKIELLCGLIYSKVGPGIVLVQDSRLSTMDWG